MEIILTLDSGEKRRVLLEDYIKAKTKSLQEFGYPDLTENTVKEQAQLVLNGGELGVIGMFMENEIELPKED